MIRVLNCIVEEEARRRFEADTVPALARHADLPLVTSHLLDDPLPDPDSGISHLLVSGSELSAARPHPVDQALERTIRAFVEAGRPTLGICYGHQVIAKALAGAHVCRRAARPEVGWRRVSCRTDPLFRGLESFVVAHSHYDEVHGLPEDRFDVIAWTDDCAVQAFRLRGRPVWGVQFHPEIDYETGRAMFQRNLDADASLGESFHDELDDPDELACRERIFQAFFRTGSGEGA